MENKQYVTVEDFEAEVWRKEGVLVVIRAARDVMVPAYAHKNALPKTKSVSDLRRIRLEPKLAGIPHEIIGGDYEFVHGRTMISTLNDSYGKNK